MMFTLVLGVIFYDLFNMAGFSYIDEICAFLLFILFGINVLRSKNWAFDKIFLLILGIFLFYLVYSLYIGSNSPRAILMDFVIQIKPYLAFFCVYSMRPVLNANQKKILRQLAILFSLYLLLIGTGDLFIKDLMLNILSHTSRFATATSILALLYLYFSDYTKRDKLIFILLLSIGLFSGRSKLFGFLALCTLIMLYINKSFEMKFNIKNTLFLLFAIIVIAVVAKDKIELYFITGGFGGGRGVEDLYARMALYYFSVRIFRDYIPFGSGFASYGTYASGEYYSPIYAKYSMERMHGLNEADPSFIADTYYPALAQFGLVGLFLFFLFWYYLTHKAIISFRKGCQKEAVIAIIIIAFFLIESISDATLTHNRGFFMMMLLGLIFSDIKYKLNTTPLEKVKTYGTDTFSQ